MTSRALVHAPRAHTRPRATPAQDSYAARRLAGMDEPSTAARAAAQLHAAAQTALAIADKREHPDRKPGGTSDAQATTGHPSPRSPQAA